MLSSRILIRYKAIRALVYSLLTTTWVVAQQDQVNYQELYHINRGSDPLADLEAFPVAPEGFRVSLIGRGPGVQNPFAIAFDQRGRIFIGQGPQWRHNQIDSRAQDVSGLGAFSAGQTSAESAKLEDETGFDYEVGDSELRITLNDQPIATYAMADKRVGRPFFYDLYTKEGTMVTRNFPPVEGVDSIDHAFMHPGLWTAYGDINGQDYWRNKATVPFQEFVDEPKVEDDGTLRFAVKYGLSTVDGDHLGTQTSRFIFSPHPDGYFITWEEAYVPVGGPLVFGDYEEMGLGVRVTTPMIEKNGGLIRNSRGGRSAEETFAKEAVWSDYSARLGNRFVGVTLMADPSHFRGSYWHNRDYGLLLANPFGRKAYLRVPERRPTMVEVGETLQLRFGVLVHSGHELTSKQAIDEVYQKFLTNDG